MAPKLVFETYPKRQFHRNLLNHPVDQTALCLHLVRSGHWHLPRQLLDNGYEKLGESSEVMGASQTHFAQRGRRCLARLCIRCAEARAGANHQPLLPAGTPGSDGHFEWVHISRRPSTRVHGRNTHGYSLSNTAFDRLRSILSRPSFAILDFSKFKGRYV